MAREKIAGYDIDLEQAAETGSLQALKDDQRFFHQHTGKERNDLCKQLWDLVKGGKQSSGEEPKAAEELQQ